jgi:hypothetical protein
MRLLNGRGLFRREICAMLGVGPCCVSRALTTFARTAIVPHPLPRAPRKKATNAIRDFIDVRPLQQAHLSSTCLTAGLSGDDHVLITQFGDVIARIGQQLAGENPDVNKLDWTILQNGGFGRKRRLVDCSLAELNHPRAGGMLYGKTSFSQQVPEVANPLQKFTSGKRYRFTSNVKLIESFELPNSWVEQTIP